MIDLVGRKFGRLEVIRFSHRGRRGQAFFVCACECGNEVTCNAWNLQSGNTRSCRCLKFDGNNATHKMSYTPEYNSWVGMKQRCHNPQNPKYNIYGGRGIIVAKEWQDDFMAFFRHIGPRPSSRHTVERRNGNKGYVPGNVLWATRSDQNANRRDQVGWKTITYQGHKITLRDASRISGLHITTMHRRFNRGLSDKEIVT